MFLSRLSSTLRQSNIASFAARNVPAASINTIHKRFLNIHEYQSQNLMRQHGVRVPEGGVATSAEEAEQVAISLDSQDLVIKAQILAGGRGMGKFDSGLKGGVHICSSPAEVKQYASQMLGHKLVTKQTGPAGKLVNKVLVTQRYFIRREMYFAILLDRKSAGPMIIGSRHGGMDIESVAAENPDAIVKLSFKPDVGVSREQVKQLAVDIGFPQYVVDQAADQMLKLYDLFVKTDATQVEVNPLCETSTGEVMCLDAKINFDDNAAFRQQEIFKLRDYSQEDPREVAAAKFDLNYVGLDGNIGCLVNGAGLAMATMDIIHYHGGHPANFLDVGGGATEKQVTEALKIIASDPKVKAILINIFGGIMRCDVIALGILKAVETLKLNLPLVVRLQGTNVKEAKAILEDSGLRIIPADNLEEAANKAVRVAQIVGMAEQASLSVSFELPL